jgi:hypothetical protein
MQVSTPTTLMQVATEGLIKARNSLTRAEERRNAYVDSNPDDLSSPYYRELSDEVTRCTTLLNGAQALLSSISTSFEKGKKFY